jgi:hypothetical protein
MAGCVAPQGVSEEHLARIAPSASIQEAAPGGSASMRTACPFDENDRYSSQETTRLSISSRTLLESLRQTSNADAFIVESHPSIQSWSSFLLRSAHEAQNCNHHGLPALFLILEASAQVISFGLGDATLETSLNDIGASAKVDMVSFQAEISLSWGQPSASVQLALNQGLQPAEVYLAAAFANISGKPLTAVVELYTRDKAKGWGALAKELGIKPGSKGFKTLKDKSTSSSSKLKKNKK